MPRNFTPADRPEMMGVTEELPYVHEATGCGPGVIAVCQSGNDKIRSWAGLARNYGWYVSQYIKQGTGDIIILMPITEVPE